MLYFSIENARGEREKSPLLRGGLRRTVSCSDVARMLLGSFSDHSRIGPALEMTFQLFSRNFFEMLESHFSWQAQYLVSLDNDTCCSAHCK